MRLQEIICQYPPQEQQEIQTLIGYSLIEELHSLKYELEMLKEIGSDESKVKIKV